MLFQSQSSMRIEDLLIFGDSKVSRDDVEKLDFNTIIKFVQLIVNNNYILSIPAITKPELGFHSQILDKTLSVYGIKPEKNVKGFALLNGSNYEVSGMGILLKKDLKNNESQYVLTGKSGDFGIGPSMEHLEKIVSDYNFRII